MNRTHPVPRPDDPSDLVDLQIAARSAFKDSLFGKSVMPVCAFPECAWCAAIRSEKLNLQRFAARAQRPDFRHCLIVLLDRRVDA